MDNSDNLSNRNHFSGNIPFLLLSFILVVLLASLLFVFVRSEQRYSELKQKFEVGGEISTPSDFMGQEVESGEGTRETGREAADLIGVTFGPAAGDSTRRRIQLDWSNNAYVREIRILEKENRNLLISFQGDTSSIFVPHPYVVGSLPNGFQLTGGQLFEDLTPGEFYNVKFKGEVDGESFDVAFDFNVPELPGEFPE